MFDSVLAEFARDVPGPEPAIDDFERVASSASGQDLSWLLGQTFGASAIFDYAVADSRACQGRLVVSTPPSSSRLGDGVFTGSSAPRVGPFESGRGVSLLVAFEDGERAVKLWDGRDTRKTFSYRSLGARAVSTIESGFSTCCST